MVTYRQITGFREILWNERPNHSISPVFSRPYLSNGRAIGMVDVRMSVTDVLWLTGRSYRGKLFARIISHVCWTHTCKISTIYSQGNIFKFVVVWNGSRKMCVLTEKLAISRKRWELLPRLLLIANRKWHTPFRMKWKSSTFDDLEGHWQLVRSTILATAKLVVLTWQLDVGLLLQNSLLYRHARQLWMIHHEQAVKLMSTTVVHLWIWATSERVANEISVFCEVWAVRRPMEDWH